MKLFLAFFVAIFASLSMAATVPRKSVEELTPANPRTLVLSTAPHKLQLSHSSFFGQLESRGHTLTFHHSYDDNVRLVKHGNYLYDNLVLFASNTVDFTDNLNVNALTKFVDDGQNLLLVLDAGSGSVSEPVRLLAHELGFAIDEDGTRVIDHYHYDANIDTGSHHVVVSNNFLTNASVITGNVSGAVLFDGIAHSFSLSSQSPLSRALYIPVLMSESTALSSPTSLSSLYTGADTINPRLLLVSAYQTRSNTRVVVSGSSKLFSNQFFHGTHSANEQFVNHLVGWNFRDSGMLRAVNLTYHHPDNVRDLNPFSYRINDVTDFSIIIQQFNGNTRQWEPFIARDIQLEFTMIDPAIRLTLPHNGSGLYSTRFTVPDVYGVYKFVIDYQRLGYSHLSVSHTVSVTPYRHDQFDRFLFVAYPYYTAAATLMAAFLVFGVVFLYQSEDSVVVVTKRTTTTATVAQPTVAATSTTAAPVTVSGKATIRPTVVKETVRIA